LTDGATTADTPLTTTEIPDKLGKEYSYFGRPLENPYPPFEVSPNPFNGSY
jgi:hypothetical protein